MAYLNVGRFMCFWSTLEVELNNSISDLFGLEGIRERIITTNMSVREKINVIVTTLQEYCSQEKWYSDAKQTMARIGSLSEDRNIAAHHMFYPKDTGDAVVFLVVRARGKVKFPDIVWSINDFDRKCDEIEVAHRQLRSVVHAATRIITLADAALLSGKA